MPDPVTPGSLAWDIAQALRSRALYDGHRRRLDERDLSALAGQIAAHIALCGWVCEHRPRDHAGHSALSRKPE